MLVPKYTGALHKLQREDASFSEDPTELDQLVRKGREFWLEPVIAHDFSQLIEEYKCAHQNKTSLSQQTATSNSTESRGRSAQDPDYEPTQNHFLKAILNSADSAPGIDNIPYAYYRTNPSQHAQKLKEKLKDITEGKLPPPKQLLVWIPKAEAGYKADNWRPLSMPVTWDRLIDQAAYAAILPFFEAKLDHAQSSKTHNTTTSLR